jgi:hypothetical protein
MEASHFTVVVENLLATGQGLFGKPVTTELGRIGWAWRRRDASALAEFYASLMSFISLPTFFGERFFLALSVALALGFEVNLRRSFTYKAKLWRLGLWFVDVLKELIEFFEKVGFIFRGHDGVPFIRLNSW